MKKPEMSITVRITTEQMERLEHWAQAFDTTTGAVVREALSAYFSEHEGTPGAQDPQGTEIGPSAKANLDKFEAVVGQAVMASSDWDELKINLSHHNLELVAKGGGLSLQRKDDQSQVCKASEIGFPYSKLIERFQCGFPGHTHTWLADRVLGHKEGDVIE